MCTPEIFTAHWSEDRRRTFFHSSSYTANPIACAAALANLEIWKTEPVLERIAALAVVQARLLDTFRDDRRFSDVRQMGTITAMDLVAADAGYLSTIGPRLQAVFRGPGAVAPLANTILCCHPTVSRWMTRDCYRAIRLAASSCA